MGEQEIGAVYRRLRDNPGEQLAYTYIGPIKQHLTSKVKLTLLNLQMLTWLCYEKTPSAPWNSTGKKNKTTYIETLKGWGIRPKLWQIFSRCFIKHTEKVFAIKQMLKHFLVYTR